MKQITCCVFILLFFLFGCKENVVQDQDSKESTGDLFHADLIGKITQINSNAMVIVSQVQPIDSTEISTVDGSFSFSNLRAGNYDITVRADNYRIYKQANIQLDGGTVHYLGELTLSTVPDQINDIYPEPDGEVVSDWRYGRITVSIQFNVPMDRESVENAFSTDPPAEGIFSWGNYTQAPMYGFYSNAVGYDERATITTFSKVSSFSYALAQKDSYPDTTYTVTISTAAMDTAGHHLRFPLHFKFSTVQSYTSQNGILTTPVNGDINVQPLSNNGILVTFPRRMDQTSVEAGTHVTPPMSTTFLWPAENQLRIYTGGPLMSDTTITVTIDSTTQDKDGVLLGHDFTFSFKTIPFSVSSSYPNNGEIFVTPSNPIYIYFTNYVSLSSVQSAITVSPALSGSISYGGTNPYEVLQEIVFTPSSSMNSNTKYTITVSGDVEDLFGVNMGTPYSFSFVTRPN